MKHLHLTLGYLKEQRAKLDTSITLLEAFIGKDASSSNGHGATLKVAAEALALHEAPWRPARRPNRRGVPASLKAHREAKTQTLIEILREAGPSGLPIKDLSQAARARGIAGLTGIEGLVRNGTLKKTGKVRGQFRYSVIDR